MAKGEVAATFVDQKIGSDLLIVIVKKHFDSQPSRIAKWNASHLISVSRHYSLTRQ